MSNAGKNHCYAVLVGSRNYLGILNGAARLDDGFRPCLRSLTDAVPKRIEN